MLFHDSLSAVPLETFILSVAKDLRISLGAAKVCIHRQAAPMRLASPFPGIP
jgi:hypothetical protein